MIYLYAAFAIVWIILIAYIINLVRMNRALSKELNVLQNLG